MNRSLALDRCLTRDMRLSEAVALNINVVFTDPHATIAALKKAAELGISLRATVKLVVPLPQNRNPEPRRYPSPTQSLQGSTRNAEDRARPHSIVVIGGRKRWWPTGEQGLARKLQSRHEVIFAETVCSRIGGRIYPLWL